MQNIITPERAISKFYEREKCAKVPMECKRGSLLSSGVASLTAYRSTPLVCAIGEQLFSCRGSCLDQGVIEGFGFVAVFKANDYIGIIV